MENNTPKRISDPIRKLCLSINQDTEPMYIEVIPEQYCILNECFPNVAKAIRLNGGKAIYGWQIWEWPGIMVEAEFHGIWQKPDDTLVDITPKVPPTDQILFLRDPSLEYEGRQVNNIRRPLNNHPVIIEYTRLHDELFRIMNQGERAGQRFVAVNRREIEPIYYRLRHLEAAIRTMQSVDSSYATQPNAPCPCKSGQKYKRCCGSRGNNTA